MIDVVSVSLGAPGRDRDTVVRVGGDAVRVRRVGCNGDYEKAQRFLSELDGKVGAIGLGGLNFSYRTQEKTWPMPGATRLRQAVRLTPLVDGSGFKDAIEPQAAQALPGKGRALVVSVLDRPAAARALAAAGYRVQAGDPHFALGMPIWPSDARFQAMAAVAMPILRHLPRGAVYGERPDRTERQPARWDVIWGDVQLLRRHPVGLGGAILIGGSLRSDDADWLRQRGVRMLIAASPPVDGEVFGANVWDAILAALHGRALRRDEMEDAWTALYGRQGWVTIV